MLLSPKRWIIAIAVVLYLYFLLPTTAVLFYELYHLTEIRHIYWGYSVFKAAGYYFGVWPYQWLACLLVAAVISLLPPIWRALRESGGTP